MLYVYAFVASPAVVPDVPGIDDAPLSAVSAGELDAVVSEHGAAVDSAERDVLAHARVVEAVAAANEAVLPARFGGLHADEQALREATTARPDLRAALERVRGCVELGLRVVAEPTQDSAATSGSDYMRQRLERRRGLDRLAEELHRPLAGVARDATLTVGSTERLPLTAAYLVERDRVDEFRRRLEEIQAKQPQLGIACTGPWPPYSFALAEGKAP